MKVEVVAERTKAVSHVVVTIEQLIATRRVDGHVTSGDTHAVTCTDLLDEPRHVFHQEPV